MIITAKAIKTTTISIISRITKTRRWHLSSVILNSSSGFC